MDLCEEPQIDKMAWQIDRIPYLNGITKRRTADTCEDECFIVKDVL